MTDPEIQEDLVRLEEEIKEIKEELFRISWFMRGGVNVHDLFHTYSHEDRIIMSDIIKSNVENTKSSQMPLI
jgi:hypothetical protein